MPGLPVPLGRRREIRERRPPEPGYVPGPVVATGMSPGTDAVTYHVEFDFPGQVRLRRRYPPPVFVPAAPRPKPVAWNFAGQVTLNRRREFVFGAERLPATRIVMARRDDDELLTLL